MTGTFNLAQLVTNLLTKAGKTQTEVERELRKRDLIGQLLRGEKKTLTEKNMRELARVLQVDPGHFVPDMNAGPAKSPYIQRAYFGPPRVRRSAAQPGSPTNGADLSGGAHGDINQSRPTVEVDGENQGVTQSLMLLGHNQPLKEVVWIAAGQSGDTDAKEPKLSASTVIRTALPIFQLRNHEGRLFLDFKERQWQPRPHSLVRVPGAYGIVLPFSVYPHLKSGTIIILEPGKSLSGGDWVLGLRSANVAQQHEVDLQIVRSISSAGVRLGALNTPSVPAAHADQRYYRVHRVHSIQL